MDSLKERHKEILTKYSISDVNLCLTAIFCESNLENLEKALVNCNKAILKINYVPFLPCPGEGWNVSIDPDDSVELRGRGFVEIEFIYGIKHPESDIEHIPIILYKNLVEERYHILKSENFFPNGQIKRKGNYLNGLREGLWTEYYENGNILSEGEYKESNKINIWKYYYDTGQIRERKDYNQKIYLISQTNWYENGQIKYDWMYNENTKIFNCTFYREDGSISSESKKYNENTYADGEHKTYFRNGKADSVIVTENNRIIQYRYYNLDGTIKRISEN